MDEPTLPLAMQEAFGPVQDELIERLRRYDEFGNGRVMYSDFLEVCASLGVHIGDAAHSFLSQTFTHRGYIDINRLAEVLGKRDKTIRPRHPSGRNEREMARLHELVVTKLYARHEHIRDMFLELDVSRNGTLSYREFANGLASLGLELDEEQLAALMRQHDMRGSGRIDYNEFVRFVQDPLTWSLPSDVAHDDSLVARLFAVREALLNECIARDTAFARTIPFSQLVAAIDSVLTSVPLPESELEFVLSTFADDTSGDNPQVAYLDFVRHVTTRGRELMDPAVVEPEVARAFRGQVPTAAVAPCVLSVDVPVLDLLREIVYEAHGHVAESFLELDADRSGTVSLDDVLTVLGRHYIRPTPAQIQEIAATFGVGDGIDYRQFCQFLGEEDPVAAEEAARHLAVLNDAPIESDDTPQVFDTPTIKSAVAKLYVKSAKLLSTILEYTADDALPLPTLRQALHRLHIRLSHAEFEWITSKFGILGPDGTSVTAVCVHDLVHFVTQTGRAGLAFGGH
ncbi:uncharacterized protein AMSG_03104 [Thecamonas trahens ATCC 50062]|uniref:EF-hand domain-containing protein n=1 Tax=Thecamonas trahens ATCC 50062 TaxID=461836 RepID=A0A0L0D2W9_THETB|nr:hypothetical protein AMSG_03104 [Thecamonas trahens ATCC 50062]KNC46667.1 hypothetical protein AMSG_03104 [Thecamonas trahens ATCC 50062]|eukprot:XP_013760439.1 hypothetical protein AMSG_03104 [Thecamonas trahens ATCC 50062]